jgi:hypothetical protein
MAQTLVAVCMLLGLVCHADGLLRVEPLGTTRHNVLEVLLGLFCYFAAALLVPL